MVIVIIGSSIASKSALETMLPRLGWDDRVFIITKDKFLFYSRVLLPNYIAGELEVEDMIFAPKNLLEDDRVEVINQEVLSIDTKLKTVRLNSDRMIGYDKLIITSGASPARIEVQGVDLPGVFYLRDIEDAQAIKKWAVEAKNCAVLGGGLVSLKAAIALKKIGKNVTVVVESSQVLSMIADNVAANWVHDILTSNGINVMLNSRVAKFQGNVYGVSRVVLENATFLETDMAIIGKGVKPNIALVKNTDINTDKGILVNAKMETSVKDVYAAGDVAQSLDYLGDRPGLFTLWPDAALQGRVAASNIMGLNKEYTGGLNMNSVVFYDIPFIIIGKVREKDIGGCEVYKKLDTKKNFYRKIVVRNKRIIGAVFGGDITNAGMVYWDIRSRKEVERPEKYLTNKGLNDLYILTNAI